MRRPGSLRGAPDKSRAQIIYAAHRTAMPCTGNLCRVPEIYAARRTNLRRVPKFYDGRRTNISERNTAALLRRWEKQNFCMIQTNQRDKVDHED